VAAECLGTLNALGWDCAVLVPAFPDQGRRTVGGYQLLRGIPVEQTDVARDPLCPVRQSHLPTLMSQQLGHTENNGLHPDVGHIELSTVMHGAAPILKDLSDKIRDGKRLIVVDACSNVDMEQIALGIEKIRKTYQVLPCGSAGLAQALTRLWSCEMDTTTWHEPMPQCPIVMVIGSNSAMTREQLTQLMAYYEYTPSHHAEPSPEQDGCATGSEGPLHLFELSPDLILAAESDHLPAYQALLANIHAALTPKPSVGGASEAAPIVVVTASYHDTNYFRTVQQAEAMGLSALQASRLVERLLVRLTQAILARHHVKLVMSGGETATQLCRAIGFSSLRLVSEVEPSIPLAVSSLNGPLQGPSASDLQWMVTKSGNFGTPESLINIVRFLRQHETATLRV
jgi:uncharacterized protein YgbK (DUF1537 family)